MGTSLRVFIKHDSKLIYSGSSAIFGDNNSNLSPYSWLKAKNIELIKNYLLRYNICYFLIKLKKVIMQQL